MVARTDTRVSWAMPAIARWSTPLGAETGTALMTLRVLVRILAVTWVHDWLARYGLRIGID